MKLKITLLFLFFSIQLIAQKSNKSVFKIAELKCNYKLNPLGVETLNPRLSWTIEASENNQRQTAYRVLVADSPEELAKNQGNIWDSGKVMSEQSNQIEFGTAQNRNPTSEIRNILRGGKKYYWKVMVWDIKGKPSAWSQNALWQMGLLTPNEWDKAEWLALEKIIDSNKILPALHNEKAPNTPKNLLPQFRKTFIIANAKTIKNATAFVSGLGHFELFLNGEKVGKNFLDAGWTKYEKYAQYVTFDISNQLKQGKNAVGVMLGNGFYNIPQGRYWKILQSFGYPTFIAKIELEYTDGTIENIVSDTSWKTIASPIEFSSIFGGEDFDSNREEIGWKNADFDDNHWKKPLILTNMPPVVSQQQEPLGYFDTFRVVKITEPKPSVYVYVLGQNMSGIPYISVQGNVRRIIKISPSELLGNDSLINQSAVGGSASIILPWEMYQWYGDLNLLTDNYLMMKRYVDYLSSRATNHIVSHGLGDWFDLGTKQPGESQLTSKGVTSTATYYYDLTLLSKIALLLNKPEDAKKYEDLGKEVRKAFNATYFNAAKMSYDKSSQTAFSMAIVLGLVESENKDKVFQSLINEIENSNYALTAGDVGFHYLVSVLQNEGASDVIFKMNSRSDVPGYGFQIAKGATALTESWPALKNVSNNHLMLGHLMEWFYNGLAGIKQTDNSVAFKEIIIRPEPVGDITEVTGSYKSIYGLIKSHWIKTNNSFNLSVEIPVNTTAFIYLPRPDIVRRKRKLFVSTALITVNKKPIKSFKNIQFIKEEGDKMVFKVGSGKYDFMRN